MSILRWSMRKGLWTAAGLGLVMAAFTSAAFLWRGGLSAPAADASKKERATEQLKAIIAAIESKGTAERMTDFVKPDSWQKRKSLASDVQYTITETATPDFLPFIARVTWIPLSFVTGSFPSREEAEKAALPSEPRSPGKIRWNAVLVYMDGQWYLQDVWWYAEALNIERRHSTLADQRDPVKDWWWALGGK